MYMFQLEEFQSTKRAEVVAHRPTTITSVARRKMSTESQEPASASATLTCATTDRSPAEPV